MDQIGKWASHVNINHQEEERENMHRIKIKYRPTSDPIAYE